MTPTDYGALLFCVDHERLEKKTVGRQDSGRRGGPLSLLFWLYTPVLGGKISLNFSIGTFDWASLARRLAVI